MSTTTPRPFQVGDPVRLITPQFPDINGRVGVVTASSLLARAARVEFPSSGSWSDDLLARDGKRSAMFEHSELVRVDATPCAHTDAHHAVAGEPDLHACDECGTTWIAPVDAVTSTAPTIPSDGVPAPEPAPSDGTTPLWTDSYGEEHEVYPVGTEIVYNGIPDVVGDLDGESAVITGHDLADEVTPYEIRFTRVERMASPDHFWVPAPTADLADADRPALADALASAAHHLEVADPTCDCALHMAITTRAVATDRALRGTSSQAGLQAIVHGPTISSGGAVTTASPAPSDDSTPSLVQLDHAEATQAALVALGQAAIAWHDADPDQPAGIAAEEALSTAIEAYRKEEDR